MLRTVGGIRDSRGRQGYARGFSASAPPPALMKRDVGGRNPPWFRVRPPLSPEPHVLECGSKRVREADGHQGEHAEISPRASIKSRIACTRSCPGHPKEAPDPRPEKLLPRLQGLSSEVLQEFRRLTRLLGGGSVLLVVGTLREVLRIGPRLFWSQVLSPFEKHSNP